MNLIDEFRKRALKHLKKGEAEAVSGKRNSDRHNYEMGQYMAYSACADELEAAAVKGWVGTPTIGADRMSVGFSTFKPDDPFIKPALLIVEGSDE